MSPSLPSVLVETLSTKAVSVSGELAAFAAPADKMLQNPPEVD
jgi:hypothetical protein